MQRLHLATDGKSLPGIISLVVQQASSAHGDTAQVSSLVLRDPNLSAKVLHIANSASDGVGTGSNGAKITDVSDAIKNIGFSTLRKFVTSVGIIDATPEFN